MLRRGMVIGDGWPSPFVSPDDPMTERERRLVFGLPPPRAGSRERGRLLRLDRQSGRAGLGARHWWRGAGHGKHRRARPGARGGLLRIPRAPNPEERRRTRRGLRGFGWEWGLEGEVALALVCRVGGGRRPRRWRPTARGRRLRLLLVLVRERVCLRKVACHLPRKEGGRTPCLRTDSVRYCASTPAKEGRSPWP